MIVKKLFGMTALVLAVFFATAGIVDINAAENDVYLVHVVQPGETLYHIGRVHGVAWAVLAEYNGLDNPHLIFPGKRVRVPGPPPRFIAISGVVTAVDGPMDENGVVPWYIEWFRIEIEKEDGTPAVIIGINQTAFLFDGVPVPGAPVRAYVRSDSPVYVLPDSPLAVYVATAIVAGEWQGYNIVVRCYHSFPRDVPYIVEWPWSAATVNWPGNPWGRGSSQQLFDAVVFYRASKIVRVVKLSDEVPDRAEWRRNLQEPVPLRVERYIVHDFEVLTLPIVINARKEPGLPPAVLVNEVVFVPFRPIYYFFRGPFAYSSVGGSISFGGGGSGEASSWSIGMAEMHGLHPARIQLLRAAPVIINGLFYVPLTAFMHTAPFSNAWLFDDRIEVFSTLNPVPNLLWWWHGRKDEVLQLPVFVNGAKLDIKPIVTYFYQVLIPAEPLAQALGYSLQWKRETLPHQVREPWPVLVNSRGDAIYQWFFPRGEHFYWAEDTLYVTPPSSLFGTSWEYVKGPVFSNTMLMQPTRFNSVIAEEGILIIDMG